MKLPIDVIPNTNPPRFKWWQVFDATGTPRSVVCEGVVHPAIEKALLELIELVKTQDKRMNSEDGILSVLAAASKRNEVLQQRIATLEEEITQLKRSSVIPQGSAGQGKRVK